MAIKPIAVSSGVATVVLCDDDTLWVAVQDPNDLSTIKWVRLPPIPHYCDLPYKQKTGAILGEMVLCTRPKGHGGPCE